ncbi:hypothetical protein Pcinc_001984 [Petrolisthes cinctipes]|uniref:Uncharacterized protein n=1 Tax=Petrolisthes cinctipes TaxID=88211 RepID=A0AAE1GKK0_PETCI|nr:hypothetical protein Pcinc_001984 [Petrolisthes cinctipes]
MSVVSFSSATQLKAQHEAARLVDNFNVPRTLKDVMVANYAAYIKAELDKLPMDCVLKFKKEATTFLVILHQTVLDKLQNEERERERQERAATPAPASHSPPPPPHYHPPTPEGRQEQRYHQQCDLPHEEAPTLATQTQFPSMGNLSFSSSLLATFNNSPSPAPSETGTRHNGGPLPHIDTLHPSRNTQSCRAPYDKCCPPHRFFLYLFFYEIL